MKLKKRMVPVLVAVCVAGLVCAAMAIRPRQIRDPACKTVEPLELVYFRDFGADNFTCTGLTYDTDEAVFWVADYGMAQGASEKLPRLVKLDGALQTVLESIPLDLPGEINLQGLAYDSKEDCLWIAAGSHVYQMTKSGELIQSLSNKAFSRYGANGVCYDPETDSLWVLCYSRWLLNLDKQGEVIRRINLNYRDQDMLWLSEGKLYMTVGADYKGADNFVLCLNPATGKTEQIYRMTNAYAVEGICFVDGRVYVANDGAYHDAAIKESYIAVYEFFS